MGGVIPQNVPFEGFAEQGHVNARPAEVLFGKIRQQLRQKLQDQIFEYRHQIADDDKQSTLPTPFGSSGMYLNKSVSYVFYVVRVCLCLLYTEPFVCHV